MPVGSKLIASLLCAGLVSTANAGLITSLDQQNLSTNSFVTNDNLAQSFTPTLTGLDAFEFMNGGDAKSLLNETISIVLGDGVGGTVIATSNALSGSFGAYTILHFDFASTLALTPGTTYTAVTSMNRLASSDMFDGPNIIAADTYTGGQMYYDSGFSSLSFDLWFREGLHESSTPTVPEPFSIAMFGLGSLGMGMIVRSRKRKLSA